MAKGNDEDLNEEILIHKGTRYIKKINEDGRVSLKSYSEKHKIWVTLIFSKEDHGMRKYLTDMLTNEYIQKVLGRQNE